MLTLLPPGLSAVDQPLRLFKEGGTSKEWLDFHQVKYYTNVFVVQGDQILLGRKKRGFGKDKFNGFGGKVEHGEDSLTAAARELEEEAGIRGVLKHLGILFFVQDDLDWAFHIDIYRVDEFSGEVIESEEMEPSWFCTGASATLPSIPYEKMWADDEYWMPLLLGNQHFIGRVDFVLEDGRQSLQRWWFGHIES